MFLSANSIVKHPLAFKESLSSYKYELIISPFSMPEITHFAMNICFLLNYPGAIPPPLSPDNILLTQNVFYFAVTGMGT